METRTCVKARSRTFDSRSPQRCVLLPRGAFSCKNQSNQKQLWNQPQQRKWEERDVCALPLTPPSLTGRQTCCWFQLAGGGGGGGGGLYKPECTRWTQTEIGFFFKLNFFSSDWDFLLSVSESILTFFAISQHFFPLLRGFFYCLPFFLTTHYIQLQNYVWWGFGTTLCFCRASIQTKMLNSSMKVGKLIAITSTHNY